MIWRREIPQVGTRRFRRHFCLFPYTYRRDSVEETYWLMWITIEEKVEKSIWGADIPWRTGVVLVGKVDIK